MDDLKVRLSGEKPFNGAELRDALARIEKLEAALEPFAKIGDNFSIPGGWADTDRVELSHGFRVLDKMEIGAFRNARATITSSAR